MTTYTEQIKELCELNSRAAKGGLFCVSCYCGWNDYILVKTR
jgi:hypothetical protein